MIRELRTGRRGFLAGGAATAALLAGLGKARSAEAITYWHHFASQVVFAGFEEVMAGFAAENPEIELVQETIPNADFMQKFTAAVVAESRPDAVMVSAQRFPDMVAMNGLVDLSDRIATWDRAPFFPEDRFTSVTRDGGIYGVPAFSFVDWIYYRKDWFDEAGIDGPPDTFEDFLVACEKLTDPSKNRYGFGMRGGDGGQSFVTDMMRAWGSPIVEDGRVAIDKPKAVEAVGFYADLFTKYKVVPPSAPNDSFRQIMEAFRTGQTAMVWHHTGSLKEISDALPAESFGTGTRPAGPAARIAATSYLYNGLMKEDHADAAWDWVSYWGRAETSLTFLRATGYMPVATDTLEDPRISESPIYRPAVETVELGVRPLDFTGGDGWSRNVVLAEFQKILVGTSSTEDAVDAMIRGLEDVLN
ncbi:MAG: sugar ABC transporter substrate-binding protein [Pseudomonadota bacterium]